MRWSIRLALTTGEAHDNRLAAKLPFSQTTLNGACTTDSGSNPTQ
jgi:hypothetical protein